MDWVHGGCREQEGIGSLSCVIARFPWPNILVEMIINFMQSIVVNCLIIVILLVGIIPSRRAVALNRDMTPILPLPGNQPTNTHERWRAL